MEAMALLAAVLAIDTFEASAIVSDKGKLLGLFRLLNDCLDHASRVLQTLLCVTADEHVKWLGLLFGYLWAIEQLFFVVHRLFLTAFAAQLNPRLCLLFKPLLRAATRPNDLTDVIDELVGVLGDGNFAILLRRLEVGRRRVARVHVNKLENDALLLANMLFSQPHIASIVALARLGVVGGPRAWRPQLCVVLLLVIVHDETFRNLVDAMFADENLDLAVTHGVDGDMAEARSRKGLWGIDFVLFVIEYGWSPTGLLFAKFRFFYTDLL